MSPQPPPVRSCVTVIDADAYLKFLQEVFGDLPVVLAFFFGQEVLAGELTEFNWFPQTKGCILGCVDDNLDWGNKNTYQHQTLESRWYPGCREGSQGRWRVSWSVLVCALGWHRAISMVFFYMWWSWVCRIFLHPSFQSVWTESWQAAEGWSSHHGLWLLCHPRCSFCLWTQQFPVDGLWWEGGSWSLGWGRLWGAADGCEENMFLSVLPIYPIWFSQNPTSGATSWIILMSSKFVNAAPWLGELGKIWPFCPGQGWWKVGCEDGMRRSCHCLWAFKCCIVMYIATACRLQWWCHIR